MAADLIERAREDVLEGRRRVAAQESLVDDLMRIGCRSLLPMAERLLRHTRERQDAREQHLLQLLAAGGQSTLEQPDPVVWIAPKRHGQRPSEEDCCSTSVETLGTPQVPLGPPPGSR